MLHRFALASLAILFLVSSIALASGEKVSNADDPDFAVQGEYIGEIKDPGGEVIPVGVQVIARGGGKFHAVAYFRRPARRWLVGRSQVRRRRRTERGHPWSLGRTMVAPKSKGTS